MGLGRRKRRQDSLWIATEELPRTGGHVFYERANRVLDEHGFDRFAEEACAKFYAPVMGRPGVASGVYFRMQLIGYFEGLDSERSIAWRCADSLNLREFLGVGLTGSTPDYSTVSRTRRLIDLDTHSEVFSWMLAILGRAGLIEGKTVGVDAATLEANAAMRPIVRRDNGEAYNDFLTRLAKESGIDTPTRQDLAKRDRKRPKKGSNQDWEHPHDPDARITKMKDGRTHLAHKVEHAVDMKTGAVLAVTVQGADQGDTTTEAALQLERVAADSQLHLRGNYFTELVTDKGVPSDPTVGNDAGLQSEVGPAAAVHIQFAHLGRVARSGVSPSRGHAPPHHPG